MQAEAVSQTRIPQLLDTHAHLHFDAFKGEVDAVLRRAEEAGVTRVISVGVNTADSRAAVDLAGRYAGVWAAVGIHPHDADEAKQGKAYLGELAGRRKVVAIGECGLDFYKAATSPQEQEQALRMQIELAQERDLPLIFHVREAFEQFFKVVSDYPRVRGVVHSFTGGPKEVERVLDAGLHIALNGIVTFTKDTLHLEAARLVPADRLLLETDCPFLSPAPHRGKTNEPSRVLVIAETIADLRGEAPAALAATTTANAERLFDIEGIAYAPA